MSNIYQFINFLASFKFSLLFSNLTHAFHLLLENKIKYFVKYLSNILIHYVLKSNTLIYKQSREREKNQSLI